MAHLKRWFISLFLVVTTVIITHSVIRMLAGFSLEFAGIFISSATILGFFIWLFVGQVPRTSKCLKTPTAVVGIGFIMTVAGLIQSFSLLTALSSILLIAGWFAYLQWYSKLDKKNQDIFSVGNILPDFTVEDSQKETVSSEKWKGSYTVFMFYRGNWCPICTAQIQEAVDQYQRLKAREAHVVLISSQPHKLTEALAKRFDVDFEFVVDVDGKVAKQFNIEAEAGTPAGFELLGYDADTVMPTVIVTDKAGRIIYYNVADNYRVRPEPDVFLEVIDAAQAINRA